MMELIPNLTLDIAPALADTDEAQRLRDRFSGADVAPDTALCLRLDEDGLVLVADGQTLRGDFSRMLPRIKPGRISTELLVRAARIKGEGHLTAIDATAGLGEDSLLLAAAGFRVTLFERNPVIHALLDDALARAAGHPELAEIVARMTLCYADSVEAMAALTDAPDVILLDPMFPERQKSALVKKKLQMIQRLEIPCADERTLLLTAMGASPKKLIVKRPPKGPHLAGIKPDHSIEGKAVRFDCFVAPANRLARFAAT